MCGLSLSLRDSDNRVPPPYDRGGKRSGVRRLAFDRLNLGS
jgi:hypothetical protein